MEQSSEVQSYFGTFGFDPATFPMDSELDPGFLLYGDRSHPYAVVLSSPHSGINYIQKFRAQAALTGMVLRRSEDAFVDRLFLPATISGITLLAAQFPRAYVDVNRQPYELDPAMFEEVLPDGVNHTSQRVSNGLGTIARIIGENQEIYGQKLSLEDALTRIFTLYFPYHRALETLLRNAQNRHGKVLLLDCHSMPSSQAKFAEHYQRLDFTLGNRFGASCDPDIIDFIEDYLKAFGYHCLRNRPFAGGFITEFYGRPSKHCHSVQIEINRALYMDENDLTKNQHFNVLAAHLCEMVAALGVFLNNRATPQHLAAE